MKLKKTIFLALMTVLLLAIVCSACKSGDGDSHSPTPTNGTSGTDNPSGADIDGIGPDSEESSVRYVPWGVDSITAGFINSGSLDEFIDDGEFVVYATRGDFNGDGRQDMAILTDYTDRWTKDLDRYTGEEDGFLTFRILLSGSNDSYTLKAENSGMARTSVRLDGLRFSDMVVKDGCLIITNIQTADMGLDEIFYCVYSDGRFILERYDTVSMSNEYFFSSYYIENYAENFGVVDVNDFIMARVESDAMYDNIRSVSRYGRYNITKTYPDFKIYDKSREKKMVALIEEDFDKGAKAVQENAFETDVTIRCEKLFQNKSIMSFIFNVYDDKTDTVLFSYTANIDSVTLKHLSASEQYTASQLNSILLEQENMLEETNGYTSSYKLLGEDIIMSALSDIDNRDMIGAPYSIFSIMTAGSPKIVVSQTSDTTGQTNSSEGGNVVISPLGETVVRNATQLVKAIGSGKSITLSPGVYNLSEVPKNTVMASGISFAVCDGGVELVISGISDLKLISSGQDSAVEIITEYGNANVLKFVNCKNVEISNINLNHRLKNGVCTAATVRLSGCNSIKFESCTLSGGGTIGINANDCVNIEFSNSVIENCTEAIVKLNNVTVSAFRHATFRNNRGLDMIVITDSRNIIFNNSDINNNISSGGEYSFFNVQNSASIAFTNSSITNNNGLQPQSRLNGISFMETTSSGNSFRFDFPYTADVIGENDLSIGVVKIGMTRSELENKLAAPLSELKTFDDGDAISYDTVYHYMEIDTAIYNDIVYAIKVTDKYMQSARSIKLGDSVEDVYTKYGYADINNGELLYAYTGNISAINRTIYMFFKIMDGKVTSFGIKT